MKKIRAVVSGTIQNVGYRAKVTGFARVFVTAQVPKTTISGLHYAGTTQDRGHIVTKQGI